MVVGKFVYSKATRRTDDNIGRHGFVLVSLFKMNLDSLTKYELFFSVMQCRVVVKCWSCLGG